VNITWTWISFQIQIIWQWYDVCTSLNAHVHFILIWGPSWSWSYDSWIYNYLCNQCLSPLMLWVWSPLGQSVLDTTLCDKVCQWFAAGQWFSPGTPVFSTNQTNHHNITEILLKVVLNTITPTLFKSDTASIVL
jgi:hypothetical protein